MDRSPRILRNRGVEISLGVLNGDQRSLETDANDELVTEKVWLRFTVAALAELEERYGGQYVEVQVPSEAGGEPETRRLPRDLSEVLNEQIQAKPRAMAIELIALGTGIDASELGARLLPELVNDYNAAVGAAYAIAMGVDPATAGKALARSVKQADVVRDAMQNALEEWGQPESPGATGSPPGLDSVEASTSSGG